MAVRTISNGDEQHLKMPRTLVGQLIEYLDCRLCEEVLSWRYITHRCGWSLTGPLQSIRKEEEMTRPGTRLLWSIQTGSITSIYQVV